MSASWLVAAARHVAKRSKAIERGFFATGFAGLAPAIGSCRAPTVTDHGLRELWMQTQVGYSYARPVVFGDVVYFGTGDGQVVARNASTGQLRWASVIGAGAVEGNNLLLRSGVVVAPFVAYTAAADATTGRLLWKYSSPLDTVGRGTAATPGLLTYTRIDADDRTVYIPAWGASISAVDIATGEVRWVWRPERSSSDTAASIFRSGSAGARVSGDTVFATIWHFLDAKGLASEAWLLALDRQTGEELWRVVMPSYSGGVIVQGAPAFYENLVIFSTRGGYAYAVDRTTRQIAWQFQPKTQWSTYAEAEVVGSTVYLDGGDGSVYALRAQNGTLVWKATIGAQVSTDFLITERHVVFPSRAYLFVLDRETGTQLARIAQPRTADPFFASPAAGGSGQFFITANGTALSFSEP